MFDDSVVVVDNVDDREGTELAGVERLSTRCRIERRPVERHRELVAALGDLEDRCVKLPGVWFVVVQAFGHRLRFWTRTTSAAARTRDPRWATRRRTWRRPTSSGDGRCCRRTIR